MAYLRNLWRVTRKWKNYPVKFKSHYSHQLYIFQMAWISRLEDLFFCVLLLVHYLTHYSVY